MMSDYARALEAAGAKVLAEKHFGSYQGTWVALIVYNGDVMWIKGDYGSCSVCDAFQAEFGYTLDDDIDPIKLKKFGERYLDDPLTTRDIVEYFARDTSWDHGAVEAIHWIREHILKDWPKEA
jgi:hypothetical protein